MTKFLLHCAAAVMLVMAGSATVLAQNAAAMLPGGATSLQETYQDWRVACSTDGQAKQCAISQQQAQQNGQRILAIELAPAADNKVKGTMVLPFGLRLDAGVVLAIDEQAAMTPSRFSTCLPAGCLVPLVFEPAAITALRAGTALKLKATSDDGQDVALSISLAGFSSALDRLIVLTKN